MMTINKLIRKYMTNISIRKVYLSNMLDFNQTISLLLLIIQLPIFYFAKLLGIHNKGYD